MCLLLSFHILSYSLLFILPRVQLFVLDCYVPCLFFYRAAAVPIHSLLVNRLRSCFHSRVSGLSPLSSRNHRPHITYRGSRGKYVPGNCAPWRFSYGRYLFSFFVLLYRSHVWLNLPNTADSCGLTSLWDQIYLRVCCPVAFLLILLCLL